jgi:cytidylate kinase
MMIITIGGSSGGGKSSISKALAAKLGYKRYSAGDIWRNCAAERGMALHDFNKLAKTDSSIDKMADDALKKLGEIEDDVVVEGRMAFFFIPDSIKIFVDAKPEIRAKRTMEPSRVQENHESLSVAKKKLLARDEGDVERYLKLYKINPFDMKHYDLVIDTSNKTVEQTLDVVLDFLKKNKKL